MSITERSKFRTGIDISDYIDKGIYIHRPQTGGTNYSLIIEPGAGYVGIGTNTPSKPFEVVPGTGTSFSVNKEGNRTVVRIMSDRLNPVLQIGRDPSTDFVNLEYDGSNLNVVNKNLTVNSNIGAGVSTGTTSKVDINGAGYSQLRLRTKFTPVSTFDSRGNVGDFAWDDNYFYVKTTDGWKRTPMTNF